MILIEFYRGIIESILSSSIIVWFGRISQKDLQRMVSAIKSPERIIGTSLQSLQIIYFDKCQKLAKAVVSDKSHPANYLLIFLPSGKRFKSFHGNKRFTESFHPAAGNIYNSS